MTLVPIPLVDIAAQHRQIEDVVRRGFERVLETGTFIHGEEVFSFERNFAAFVGARHCVAVANGTDAIELALRAADIGVGDEVILPANTFIATALAVLRCGATPVLVDCEPDSHLIDCDAVADRIGSRTRGIIAVHLYGQMAVRWFLWNACNPSSLPRESIFSKMPRRPKARRDSVAARVPSVWRQERASTPGRTSGRMATQDALPQTTTSLPRMCERCATTAVK